MTPPETLAADGRRAVARAAAAPAAERSRRVRARALAGMSGEILGDLSRVALGADDVPRRLLAGHDAPVPADGDDDPAVAGHLRGLGNKTQLAGFGYNEMIAYLLLTNISRMFSSMPGLAGGIAARSAKGR